MWKQTNKAKCLWLWLRVALCNEDNLFKPITLKDWYIMYQSSVFAEKSKPHYLPFSK